MQGTLLDGRYLLGELIGEGGMGAVWRARDTRLGRDVAVKTLRSFDLVGKGSAGAAERFKREVRTAGRLSSPYIVTVHDAGETQVDGRSVLYLVMELLRGQSLEERLSDGLPTLAEVAVWARQICGALEVAHAAGVVHRDLKPANVWVGEDGRVKVVDFGIARFLHDTTGHTRLTATGAWIGTPAYMSPEQAQGADENRPLDQRSDLYSLGCLLYEMVTGVPPFLTEQSPIALIWMHMQAKPVSPRRRRQDLPPQWERLIMDLLKKKPERRPRSAEAVRLRIEEWSSLRGRAGGALTAPSPADATAPRVADAPPAADDVDRPPQQDPDPRRSAELREKATERVRLRGDIPPGALALREQRALRAAGGLSLAGWIFAALIWWGGTDPLLAGAVAAGAGGLGWWRFAAFVSYVPGTRGNRGSDRDLDWAGSLGGLTILPALLAGFIASPPSSVPVFLAQGLWLLAFVVFTGFWAVFVAAMARGEDHVPSGAGVIRVHLVQPGMVAALVGWAAGMTAAGAMLAAGDTWWVAILSGGGVWLGGAMWTAIAGNVARLAALRRSA
ncbi:protein kinase domain-containing protein [Streptomyces sp. 6N223]|uniref:protein kinase domain-containing protein n=1 Tax=Streptomyces sp. 6N223 TaxID=3457412 RepID=UPI003FD5DF2C